nr:hypothetical protein [Micromonospora nigra]
MARLGDADGRGRGVVATVGLSGETVRWDRRAVVEAEGEELVAGQGHGDDLTRDGGDLDAVLEADATGPGDPPGHRRRRPATGVDLQVVRPDEVRQGRAWWRSLRLPGSSYDLGDDAVVLVEEPGGQRGPALVSCGGRVRR